MKHQKQAKTISLVMAFSLGIGATTNLHPIFAQTSSEKCYILVIDKYIGELKKSENSESKVYTELTHCDTKIVPDLINALKSSNQSVQFNASTALTIIAKNDKDSLPFIITALKDNDRNVRSGATFALGKIGKDAVPALINALKDSNFEVRFYAVFALGKIGEDARDAVPALKNSLKDSDKNVRYFAAEALKKIDPSIKF